MSEIEDEFDDPAFKAAVKRAAGVGGDDIASSRAPAALRGRIRSMLAADAAGGAAVLEQIAGQAATTRAPRGALMINRELGRVAALAACVLLALGYLAYQIREEFFPPRPALTVATSIPATYIRAIVRTHDSCAGRSAHDAPIPGSDPDAAALREKLTAGAKVAASTVSLGGDWQFKGAGLCQVDDTRAAHLLFVRKDDFVSIFSMPAPASCGYGDDWYRETCDAHPVAGFRHGEALYCVVASGGDGTFTQAELEPVLQKVRTSVASGCMSHPTVVAAAKYHPSTPHRRP